jgi:glyoxylase-like metal-dependent hydrolase (beta-lactamase superfamily II)
MTRMNTGGTSPYFHIEQLADGVYAALVREGSGALGNAGIIDLGDETVLFDTMLTPGAAFDLRAAAEQLTRHRIRYVVNSHWHRDHVYGNQVFTDADIISDSFPHKAVF